MNRGNLDPDFVLAEALKVSILRLVAAREAGAGQLHQDDWAFGEDALVLLLAQLNTHHSRKALLDLQDFLLDDAIWDAISEAAEMIEADLLPEMKARIGCPPCTQAQRPKPYVEALSPESRDKQIRNWLSEMTPEAKAQTAAWLERMNKKKP